MTTTDAQVRAAKERLLREIEEDLRAAMRADLDIPVSPKFGSCPKCGGLGLPCMDCDSREEEG